MKRIFPGWVNRFNRIVTNRVIGKMAGKVPPYTMIHHIGRRSGTLYHIPVGAYQKHGRMSIGLAYGDDADWVRNVLAAGGAEATYRRRTVRLIRPRIVHGGAADLPLPARAFARTVGVLVCDIAE